MARDPCATGRDRDRDRRRCTDRSALGARILAAAVDRGVDEVGLRAERSAAEVEAVGGLDCALCALRGAQIALVEQHGHRWLGLRKALLEVRPGAADELPLRQPGFEG